MFNGRYNKKSIFLHVLIPKIQDNCTKWKIQLAVPFWAKKSWKVSTVCKHQFVWLPQLPSFCFVGLLQTYSHQNSCFNKQKKCLLTWQTGLRIDTYFSKLQTKCVCDTFMVIFHPLMWIQQDANCWQFCLHQTRILFLSFFPTKDGMSHLKHSYSSLADKILLPSKQ